MAQSLVNSIIFLRLLSRNFVKRPLLPILKLIISIRKPKLILCFDARNVRDGTGAQIQRIMAIYSLATYLGLDYLHNPVEEVSIHPLDPHQSPELYSEYLSRLNSIASLPSEQISFDLANEIVEPKLTFSKLLKQIVGSYKSNPTLIKLSDVYSLVDTKPKVYALATKYVENNIQQLFHNLSFENQDIVVHYRSVPGHFSTYPGESRTRQLEIERVKNVLKRAIRKSAYRNPNINVYTDAPEKDKRIAVASFQQHIWENTPGYENGFLTLTGLDTRHEFGLLGKEIDFFVGGDPLETLVHMSRAKTLIIGKSSLSFVASLLNRHQDIYSPLEFWHPVPGSKKF